MFVKATFGSCGFSESAYASYPAYRRQWYEKNREKCLAQMKAYNEAHKEEIKDYKRMWFQRRYIKKGRYGREGANAKRVKQYDLYTGELLGEYKSIYEASEDNNINNKTIRYALKNNGGVCSRLGWKFELVGDDNVVPM